MKVAPSAACVPARMHRDAQGKPVWGFPEAREPACKGGDCTVFLAYPAQGKVARYGLSEDWLTYMMSASLRRYLGLVSCHSHGQSADTWVLLLSVFYFIETESTVAEGGFELSTHRSLQAYHCVC